MSRMNMALVKSRSGGKSIYTISRVEETEIWQCSCPGWTRRTPRIDCTHIQGCKLEALGQKSGLTITWTDHGEAWRERQETDTATVKVAGFQALSPKKLTKKKPAAKPVNSRFSNLDIDD